MGITDVINSQAELLDLWAGPTGRKVMREYASETGESATIAHAKIVRELYLGEPIWVSSEICDLLEFAVKSWPDKFTLRKEDVPLRHGFVMFERPLWLPFREEGVTEETGEEGPQKADLAFASWEFGNDVDVRKLSEGRDALSYSFYVSRKIRTNITLGIFHSAGWIVGDNENWAFRLNRYQQMHDSTASRASMATKYLMCFLRFISQKIIVGEPEKVIKNKGARKRLENSKLGRVPDIYIIKLRRSEQPKASCEEGKGEESIPGRKYDNHRWPVSAHWHNYHFRTTGEYRPKWVDSYVKGPEDKPLIVPKKRAYKVER